MARLTKSCTARLGFGSIPESMYPDWVRLREVLEIAVSSSPPSSGVQQLVNGLEQIIGAESSVLYLLHLDEAKFILSVGDHSSVHEAPRALDVELIDPSAPQTFADTAVQSGETHWRIVSRDGISWSQMALPLKRFESCLGLLLVQRKENEFALEERLAASFVVQAMIPIIEKQSSLQLLQAMQKPIDFHKPMHDYLDDLLLLIAGASGMPMIAIRELDPESGYLSCIARFGLNAELNALDMENIRAYPPFLEAIEKRQPVALPDVDFVRSRLNGLLERPGLTPVHSFVVAPIFVGDTTFGTLSFAASVKYKYSALELAGFETIANAIGTSISNYRNAQKIGQLFQIEGAMAVGLAAVEVAQAARHEARGVVEAVNTELANLKFLVTQPKDNVAKINSTVGRIYSNTERVTLALNKIKDVSKPPVRELTKSRIRQLIQESYALVSGKLTSERINFRIAGKEMDLDVYPERLRHAFLNLFLNSIDAFAVRRKQSNREILVDIGGDSANSDFISVRYSDNASGIDPTKLKNVRSPEGTPVSELIFEPGVTSKETGSGYGLFLVRRIIDDHGGSINLRDHKQGVVFDIELSKTLRAKPS